MKPIVDRWIFIALRMQLIAVSVLCLAGCSSMYSGYSADRIDLSKPGAYDTIYQSLKGKVSGVGGCFGDTYRPDADKREFCVGQRNQVISILMIESGAVCVEHLNKIYGKEAAINIASGSIASLASGFAAITAGGGAKTLSALSSFASGERSLINEVVYKNLLTTAVATKIQESRALLGKNLIAKKTQPYDSYRVEEAIHDVVQYHEACAFHRGLEIALAEGTNSNSESKRQALEVKAQALANQIDTRAGFLGMNNATKQVLLDSKSNTAAIGDPVLRGLVDQYQAVMQQILIASAGALDAAKQAPPSKSVMPSLVDPAREDVPDPLRALNAAIDAVGNMSDTTADAIAKEGKSDDKELSDVYVKALKKNIDIKTSFRSFLYNKLLPAVRPTPDNTIAKALEDYIEAQRIFVVESAPLNLSLLADEQKRVGLVADLTKKELVLKYIVSNIQKCKAEAQALFTNFQKLELAALAKLTAVAKAKLDDIQSKPPIWATSTCLP